MKNLLKYLEKKSRTRQKTSEIVFKYSDFYKKEFTELRSFIQKQKRKFAEQEIQLSMLSRMESSLDIQKYFLKYISENLNKMSVFSQLYIPAGRSFFANLKNSIFTFLSESNTVDPFLTAFGTFYEKYLVLYPKQDF
jgi:hypothetical protein